MPPVAVVLDLPPRLCGARTAARPDRDVPAHALRRQAAAVRRSLRGGGLRREGFRSTWTLSSPEAVDAAVVERVPLKVDRSDLTGPFDVIGDVHGCAAELVALLRALGYEIDGDADGIDGGSDADGDGDGGSDGDRDGAGVGAVPPRVRHPEGRTAVLLGDLVDRGPATPAVLRLGMRMVADGTALCVVGNHDDKLKRALQGRRVRVSHGLAESLAQLDAEPPAFRDEVVAFLDDLPTHLVLDGGRLVVAHAGLKEEYQGRRVADRPGLRDVRRDDRRDRRARPADPRRLGGPVPGSRRRRVRAHPGRRPAVGERRDRRRHRLRVRRAPDRAALAGAGPRVRARRADVLRAREAAAGPDHGPGVGSGVGPGPAR